MKLLNTHILVKLLPKEFDFSGTQAFFDTETRTLRTEHLEITQPPEGNPAFWCSDHCLVVESNNPEIQVGDIGIVEYIAITNALGRWLNPHETQDCPTFVLNGLYNNVTRVEEFKGLSGLHVLIPDRYFIYLIRSGQNVAVNQFNIISPCEEEQSSIISVSKRRRNQRAIVHLGLYQGMTVVYDPRFIYGGAQGLMYEGKKVEVLKDEHVLGVIEE